MVGVNILKMTDLDLKGKRVLIREDLNVPVAEGRITSDARIRAALPTIQHALKAGARVMLVSHLGRPKEGEYDPELSLAPVAERLTALLGVKVPLVKDWIDGVDVEPGSAVLCENVRFLKGEKKDDEALARKMAASWAAFATTGNPSTSGLKWGASTPENNPTMIWDNDCRMVDDPEAEARKILLS